MIAEAIPAVYLFALLACCFWSPRVDNTLLRVRPQIGDRKPYFYGAIMQFIGTADTVAAKVAKLQALGFNYITVGTGTPYVPRPVRHDMLRRFAEEVIPRFAGHAAQTAEA